MLLIAFHLSVHKAGVVRQRILLQRRPLQA